jgi:hypothetical protein
MRFMMVNTCAAKNYVRFFKNKYQGRVAIGVGYTENASEIYPLVFKNEDSESIGIVAINALPSEKSVVYIYHLGAFESQHGNGSLMLQELCEQADKFNVFLKVSPIALPNGKDPSMATEQLIEWYHKFGFRGSSGLLRKPLTVKK